MLPEIGAMMHRVDVSRGSGLQSYSWLITGGESSSGSYTHRTSYRQNSNFQDLAEPGGFLIFDQLKITVLLDCFASHENTRNKYRCLNRKLGLVLPSQTTF